MSLVDFMPHIAPGLQSLLGSATAVINATAVSVVFRQVQEPDPLGQVQGGFRRQYLVGAPRASLPATLPVRGDPITVNGAVFFVGSVDTDPITGWTWITVARRA